MGAYDLSVGGWVFACICGLVVGASKCGLPGLGTLAVPLMASVLPAKMATGALLPLLIFGDTLGVIHFRRHANWKILFRLFPPAFAGIVIGFFLLGRPWMDDQVIRISTGVIVLALVVMNAFKGRLHSLVESQDPRRPSVLLLAIGFGLLAGVTTMLANAAGPVILVYLLLMQLPKDEFIGTSAWYFVVLNWCKVPFMVYRGMISVDSLAFNAWLAPAILVGAGAGIFLSGKMSNKSFIKWVEVLTIIAAIMLFFPKGFLTSLIKG
jgi:uncharacterized membrane protein YfcA